MNYGWVTCIITCNIEQCRCRCTSPQHDGETNTFPFLHSVLIVSKNPRNSLPSCCSLFFRINVFKNHDASISEPKPRTQFRNHHGPLLRLRLKFLSFVNLPNFRMIVERELLIVELRYTKTSSASYIRGCVLCLMHFVGTKVT